MEHHTTTSRAEAERLLGIADKLLRNKDLSGCRDFAILAQETEPLLEGSEQILAVAEVLLAAESRRLGNSHHDWYSILQIPNRNGEIELIRKQYRRLALLLHPDKNKFAFADSAFRLVADAWAVLSDPAKKSAYDSETEAIFAKVDLVAVKKPYTKRTQQASQSQRRPEDPSNSQQKLPVRRSGRSGGAGKPTNRKATPLHNSNVNSRNLGNFWTACPYCYNLYEYTRVYEGCCLRCDNVKCRRAFTAAEVLSMPPMVPGKEAYFCCWGFFPMGFRVDGANGFPKWMPPLFGDGGMEDDEEEDGDVAPPPPPPRPKPRAAAVVSTGKKKRGRPKKNL